MTFKDRSRKGTRRLLSSVKRQKHPKSQTRKPEKPWKGEVVSVNGDGVDDDDARGESGENIDRQGRVFFWNCCLFFFSAFFALKLLFFFGPDFFHFFHIFFWRARIFFFFKNNFAKKKKKSKKKI